MTHVVVVFIRTLFLFVGLIIGVVIVVLHFRDGLFDVGAVFAFVEHITLLTAGVLEIGAKLRRRLLFAGPGVRILLDTSVTGRNVSRRDDVLSLGGIHTRDYLVAGYRPSRESTFLWNLLL